MLFILLTVSNVVFLIFLNNTYNNCEFHCYPINQALYFVGIICKLVTVFPDCFLLSQFLKVVGTPTFRLVADNCSSSNVYGYSNCSKTSCKHALVHYFSVTCLNVFTVVRVTIDTRTCCCVDTLHCPTSNRATTSRCTSY